MGKIGKVTLNSILFIVLIFSSSVIFLPIPIINALCIDFDGSGNCQQFDDPDAPPSVKGVCVDENGCDIPNPVDNSNIGYRLSGNPDDPFDECVKQFGPEYVVYYPSTHRCGTRDQDCDAFKAGTVWDSAVQKCVYEKSGSNTTFDTSGVNSVVIGIIVIGAVGSVTVGIGVGTAKVIKNAKAKRSQNQTKEKTSYDSSKGSMPKGYDINSKPKLLRPAEPKTKTLWVEPPSPEVITDNTLYDNADEIFTPNSALEFAEYVSKHWDRIQRTDWEKYFENVGNCIIEKGGALHTTEAWAKKVKEIQYGKALDLVEHNGISAGDLLDYSANDTVQTKDVKGYAKVVAWAIAEELFNKSVKVTKVNIMPLSVGETIKNMTPAPFKILRFLVDYFGENIMDSYSCLWASFKNLPVNRLPDKGWNGV